MYHRIDSDSSLWKFLQQCLEAYNRRTDVMRDTSEAAFQTRIDELTADLRASNDQLQGTIDADKETK